MLTKSQPVKVGAGTQTVQAESEAQISHGWTPCSYTGPGLAALRQVLVEAAHGASNTTNSYLSAHYHLLAARRGGKQQASPDCPCAR